MSCGLSNPSPALPGKAPRPLNWSDLGLLAGAGEANIWAASGCVWGCLSSLLDQHVPGVPSWEGSAQTMRRRWVDVKAADPRRLQRKPLAEDGKCHSGRTIHPVVIPRTGVTGACPKTVVQGLNSYLCVCHGSRGRWWGPQRPIKTTPNVSFAFLLFCYRPLGCLCQLGAGAQRERRVMGQR